MLLLLLVCIVMNVVLRHDCSSCSIVSLISCCSHIIVRVEVVIHVAIIDSMHLLCMIDMIHHLIRMIGMKLSLIVYLLLSQCHVC